MTLTDCVRLAGISRIFKDKPKDEDAALPQKDAKKKNKKGKGDASIAVSATTVEAEDEDRVLAGLTPAAQLARQHTLRSKAEAERRERESSVDSQQSSADAPLSIPLGPEVVRVTPRHSQKIVHAVAISEAEYDSEDSSDGETIEDVTTTFARSRLSDTSERMDAEFRGQWGQAYIDRTLMPKKGILKSVPRLSERLQ